MRKSFVMRNKLRLVFLCIIVIFIIIFIIIFTTTYSSKLSWGSNKLLLSSNNCEIIKYTVSPFKDPSFRWLIKINDVQYKEFKNNIIKNSPPLGESLNARNIQILSAQEFAQDICLFSEKSEIYSFSFKSDYRKGREYFHVIISDNHKFMEIFRFSI